MVLELGSWKNTILPGLTGTFIDEYLIEPSIIPDLYDVQSSDRYQEKLQTYFGGGLFQPFKGAIPKTQAGEAYNKTIIHTSWGSSIDIEYELAKDDLYSIIGRVRNFSYQARRTKEIDALQIFNHAFDTTVSTGGDGVGLCSTAHPSPVSGVANQSNYGTAPLGYDNFVTARNAMRRFYDLNGIPISVVPNVLLGPVELGEPMIGITESQLKNANFQVSVVNKTWKPQVIISQYLSDINNWFLLASREMKMHLHWYNREPLKIFDDSSTTNLIMTFAGYYRCSRDFTDYRWCYGNNV